MNRQMKKLMGYVWLLAIVLIVYQSVPVKASTPQIDTTQVGSITLNYSGGVGTFELYRIADVDENLIFKMSGDFANYPNGAKINGIKSTSEYETLAKNLETYISNNNINSYKEVTTNEKGVGSFVDLNVGMYLLLPKNISTENGTVNPAVLVIPTKISRTPEGDRWVYDLKVTPKVDLPSSEGSTTPSTGSTTPSNGGSKTPTTNTKLPQTGQLWWPVYVLSIAGVILFTIGAIKNKRYYQEG